MTFPVINTLLLSLYRAARELPVAQFQEAALELIKPMFAFDSSMWGSTVLFRSNAERNSDTRLKRPEVSDYLVHLHNEPSDMIVSYDYVKEQDKAVAWLWKHMGGTIRFNSKALYSDHSERPILDYTRKFSHSNTIIGAEIRREDLFVQWVAIYRANPNREYSEQECALMHALLPHLLEALAINRMRHGEHLDRHGNRGYHIAVVDKGGRIYHAERDFVELLRSEFGMTIAQLPGRVLSVLHQREVFTGKEIVVRVTRDAGLLFLRARQRKPIDELTKREWQVAREIAAGKTYKEIASVLRIAPPTARNHIQSIHAKLGVSSNVDVATQIQRFD